jgi:hypothetical protein
MVALGVVLIAGLAAFGPAVGSAAATTPKPSYLFVLDGGNGTMVPVAGSARTYTFTLALWSASQDVTWFTDRPTRDAGSIAVPLFVSLWSIKGKNSFAADPPNIALEYTDGGIPRTLIATMTRPTVLPPAGSRRTPALQARLTIVPEAVRKKLAKSHDHLSSHAARAEQQGTAPIPRTLKGRVGLFVDSGCWALSCITSIGTYYYSDTVYYCYDPGSSTGGPGMLYFLYDGSSYYICENSPPTNPTGSNCTYLACITSIGTYYSSTVYYCYANGQFGQPGELYFLYDGSSYYICPND